MKNKNTGPFKIIMSLRLFKEKLKELLKSNNPTVQEQSKLALELLEKDAVLSKGTESIEEFFSKKTILDQLMAFIFPTALTDNEIKAAVLPHSNEVFYCSSRLKNIIDRSEEHTSELQSRPHLVCRLLLEKKKRKKK